MPGNTLKNKRIAIVIAFRDFRDEEYFTPREILEKAGAVIKTVSTRKGRALGVDGGEVEIDFSVVDLDPSDFDATVFIGGPGCLQQLDNENSYKLIRATIAQGKVLGAICISPVILAKAGVLKEKKATVWTSPLDKGALKTLKEYGGEYQDEAVVVDGQIITATGPAAAKDFGETISKVLTEQ